ncbi:MAG: diaminopimelate epimerase [Chitinophagaceae bacterium]
MKLHFYKYQGCGNDFILLDNRKKEIELNQAQISFLCDRRFGIGGDGLMLLETARDVDFKMVYFNSDGAESSMCGNGGRCIAAFAKHLGIIQEKTSFQAIDGIHDATILNNGNVSLGMQDVLKIEQHSGYALLDTGSPHYVSWVHDLKDYDVVVEGRNIRNHAAFSPGGLNVNFTKKLDENTLEVRTYERGVEDETLSCGTGVTAAAIASSGTLQGFFKKKIITPGGQLEVSFFKNKPDAAEQVVLTGAAEFVFSGNIVVP